MGALPFQAVAERPRFRFSRAPQRCVPDRHAPRAGGLYAFLTIGISGDRASEFPRISGNGRCAISSASVWFSPSMRSSADAAGSDCASICTPAATAARTVPPTEIRLTGATVPRVCDAAHAALFLQGRWPPALPLQRLWRVVRVCQELDAGRHRRLSAAQDHIDHHAAQPGRPGTGRPQDGNRREARCLQPERWIPVLADRETSGWPGTPAHLCVTRSGNATTGNAWSDQAQSHR